jgi:hypothetical protein
MNGSVDRKKLVGEAHNSDEPEKVHKRIKGKVHAYSHAVSSGTIIAEGGLYLFSEKDWLSEKQPVADLPVLFVEERSWARSIVVDE